MLTPADIDKKQFKATRLKEGYDQEEVDEFLDRVVEDYAAVLGELKQLKNENEILRRRPTEAPTVSMPKVEAPSAMAERLLKVADETAKQHIEEAKAEADRLVRDAGGQGARIVEEAQEAAQRMERAAAEEAERIKNEGYAEKYRKFEELEKRHAKLSDAVNQLDARGRELKLSLTDALANFDRSLPNA